MKIAELFLLFLFLFGVAHGGTTVNGGDGAESTESPTEFPTDSPTTSPTRYFTMLYYGIDAATEVRRVDADGLNDKAIVTGLTNTGEIRLAIDTVDEDLYIGLSSGIWKTTIHGQGLVQIVSGVVVSGIAVDSSNRKVWWTEDSASVVKNADLDGDNIATVVPSHAGNPSGIVIDNENAKFYYGETDCGRVAYADMDGQNNVEWEGISSNTYDLLVDTMYHDKLYVADGVKISVGDLDGSNVVEFLAGNFDSPVALAWNQVSSHMFIADQGNGGSILGNIMLDFQYGTPREVIGNIGAVTGLAILPVGCY